MAKRLKMSSRFADELFRAGVPESKKLESIYRQGASLSAADLEVAVNRLRVDCRYHHLTAALIDASKNEKLATEELFSGNAISPATVAGFKWLYTTEDKGFISEDFIKNTLPAVSSSCQKRIISQISKYVYNTDLGDRLWSIVRLRSVVLSSMLLGACSNELILREVKSDKSCLRFAQLLDILKKRFDSGLELIQQIADAGKLIDSDIDRAQTYYFILKKDVMKGNDFLDKNNIPVPRGRHLTRRMIRLVSADNSKLQYLLKNLNHIDRAVLASSAPPEVYLKCFLRKFKLRNSHINYDEMLRWLSHLRDDAKLEAIEAWYQDNYGSTLVENPKNVPTQFLFLLDATTLKSVVDERIKALKHDSGCSSPGIVVDGGLLFWQSMLPDDEESLEIQMDRLEDEPNESVRNEVYSCILKSVLVLKRPQYLANRLETLVEETKDDYKAQTALLKTLNGALRDEAKFALNNEIWPHVKELIEFQVLIGNEEMDSAYEEILVVGLKKVGFDQESLLSEIMKLLNAVQVLRCDKQSDLKMLSHEKKKYFWNEALKYREELDETEELANGGSCPYHLLGKFYLNLAKHRNDARSLIQAYPKTFSILKHIVGPNMNFTKFTKFTLKDVKMIYQMLEPLIPQDEPLFGPLSELLMQEEAEKRRNEILGAFRKSKVMTNEILAHYAYLRDDRHHLQLCGRTLLHADPAILSDWNSTLNGDIAENPGIPGTSRSFDLLAMITEASKVKSNFEELCPTEKEPKPSAEKLKDIDTLTRIAAIKSLAYFTDSNVAGEIALSFMLGDYLKHSLKTFNWHISRLPTAKMADLLQSTMFSKADEYISPRKVMLNAFFENAFMFDGGVIRDVVQNLSTYSEHATIKKETLIAVFNIAKCVGEECAWPLLKTCIDSIADEDRTSFLVTLTSGDFDRYLPTKIEYVLEKVIELANFDLHAELYAFHFFGVLHRVHRNVESLSADFLLKVLEIIKLVNWTDSKIPGDLAVKIVLSCVPKHSRVLEEKLGAFSTAESPGLVNLGVLTENVIKECLRGRVKNPREVIDFFLELFTKLSTQDFRQLRRLELTKSTLDLLPLENDEDTRLAKLPEITINGLTVVANFLLRFGKLHCPILVHDLSKHLNIMFPMLESKEKWIKKLVRTYRKNMTTLETNLFLTLLGEYETQIRGIRSEIEELGQELGRFQDNNVNMLYKGLLSLCSP